MNQHLNTRERELVKAANQFKKRAENLIKSGKLSPEHFTVLESCDKLLAQVYSHAENRTIILQQYEHVKKLVQDNAQCPKCKSNKYLKLRSVFTNEQGWKMNKYNCRRCHLEFVWNRPNNPWDMIGFIEEILSKVEQSLLDNPTDEEAQQQTLLMKENMVQNLEKLKPVVESADQNLRDIRQKDEEMAPMLHDFKNFLLIEMIKLDTWQNQQLK
jgi:rubredoxin